MKTKFLLLLILSAGLTCHAQLINPGSAAYSQASVFLPSTGGTASGNITFSGSTGIVGTTGTSNATPGNVGEYVVSQVTNASPVTLTTGSASTITSLSLTAGDWDVSGVLDFQPGASTVTTLVEGGFSSANNTLGQVDQIASYPVAFATNQPLAFTWPTQRVSIASTTTIYMTAQATFSVSSMVSFGTIRARRMR